MQYLILLLGLFLIYTAVYGANTTQKGKVMIFTAPAWCPDCRRLEHTLADASIQKALRYYQVVRINANVQTPSVEQTMKAYKVIVVPTVIVFNSQGAEIKRLVGYQSVSSLRGIL